MPPGHNDAECVAALKNGNRCASALMSFSRELPQADQCAHCWRAVLRLDTATVSECRRCGRQRLTESGVRRKWYSRS